MKHIYEMTPDVRHPKPKMPPNPFFYPPDEEGHEYSKPAADLIFVAACAALSAVEVGIIWLVFHILRQGDAMTIRTVLANAFWSLVVIAFGCVLALLIWPFLVFWFPNLAN